MAVASASTHRFQDICSFIESPRETNGARPVTPGPAPRGNERYCCVIVPSSTPASTRLAVDASAASNRMRTVWPAKALMLALTAVQAPLRLAAAPSDWKAWVVVD